MRQRNYKDPTNGGTIVTFDDGTGVPEGIDIKGNIYDINKWRDILDSYGPNSFDVIFVDGGLNAGRKFGFKFAEVRAMSESTAAACASSLARLSSRATASCASAASVISRACAPAIDLAEGFEPASSVGWHG